MILIEEIIGDDNHGLADYKLYCVNGQVQFMHHIYDRGSQYRRAGADHRPYRPGMKCPLHPKFPYGESFQRPVKWTEVIALAEQASAGMRFERVDLHLVDKVI